MVLRRHAESMSALTGAEASALGPILRAGVTAIERIVKPERVYVASFNERVRHLHFYLLARTGAMPAGHVTSDLFRRGRGILRKWGIAHGRPSRPGSRPWSGFETRMCGDACATEVFGAVAPAGGDRQR